MQIGVVFFALAVLTAGQLSAQPWMHRGQESLPAQNENTTPAKPGCLTELKEGKIALCEFSVREEGEGKNGEFTFSVPLTEYFGRCSGCKVVWTTKGGQRLGEGNQVTVSQSTPFVRADVFDASGKRLLEPAFIQVPYRPEPESERTSANSEILFEDVQSTVRFQGEVSPKKEQQPKKKE